MNKIIIMIGVLWAGVAWGEDASGFPAKVMRRLEQAKATEAQIEFFGRVVDQYNKPVSGAMIEMSVSRVTVLPGALQKISKTTDADGYFSVLSNNDDIKGCSLGIDKISKDGFAERLVTGRAGEFDYRTNNPNRFVPDKNSPIVFQIRKKESEQSVLFKSHDLNFQIRADESGTAVGCDFIRRSLVSDAKQALLDSGTIYCDFQVIASLDTNSLIWTVVLKPCNTNDGIVVSEQLLYVAPEGGYSAEYTFKAEDHKIPKAKYVYLCNRDSALYTRLEINGLNANKDFFRLWTTAVTNPYGGRNLEEAANIPFQLTKQLSDEVKASFREKKRPPKPDLPKRIKDFNEKLEREKAEKEKAKR